MFTREGKKNYFIMLTAAAISAYIVVCTLGQTVHHNKEKQKHEAAAAQEMRPICTVREHEGKLAVYRYGETEPYMTMEVRVSMLPSDDRERFTEGVDLYNETELKRLIEDFSD